MKLSKHHVSTVPEPEPNYWISKIHHFIPQVLPELQSLTMHTAYLEFQLQMFVLHPLHNVQTILIYLIRTTLIFTPKFISVHIVQNSSKMLLRSYGKNSQVLTMQLSNAQTKYVTKSCTLHISLEKFCSSVLETSNKSHLSSKA